jgi:hypothetical protein
MGTWKTTFGDVKYEDPQAPPIDYERLRGACECDCSCQKDAA